jgi:hypothetical protein
MLRNTSEKSSASFLRANGLRIYADYGRIERIFAPLDNISITAI